MDPNHVEHSSFQNIHENDETRRETSMWFEELCNTEDFYNITSNT